MDKYKVSVPIRKAFSQGNFILFNTVTFQSISIDERSFRILEFIRNSDYASSEHIISHFIQSNCVDLELQELARTDCINFLNFLQNEKFIEKVV